MLVSNYRPLTSVQLPYAGRQFYMHGFDLANPVMAEGFEDYLEPVTRLIEAAGQRIGKAYMTVDEKMVMAGQSQRRPKPHVDGCFMETKMYWGHGPGWNHMCNNLPIDRMPVIVASTVSACRAWKGQFDAQPRNNGDLSHIENELGEAIAIPSNVGYLLSPDCIHESMPMSKDTRRSFLRIALPVNSVRM